MRQRQIDEILEAIWLGEEGLPARPSGLASPRVSARLMEDPEMREALKEAESLGLIAVSGDALTLTEEGRIRAANVVRRHRLAERLFSDVLDLTREEVEAGACDLEHVLSREATNSICILLGHPATCPHGKQIPRGECCQRRLTEIRPLVVPATQLHPGEEGAVAYVTSRAQGRLEHLANLGLLPGNRIALLQRRPSYVIRVDGTDLGLDDEIAAEIYVRRG
ncbi:MAG: metal-dependent transcriptional regulator [Chloroflexi bacterium]|nr:metal-dependent transcriptional regulator [Chloroflexota bacterium]